MTDLRPRTGDDTDDVGPDRRAFTGISPWQKVVGALGLVTVLWVGSDSPLYQAWFDDGPQENMHGPGGEGPPAGGAGGEAPDENQDPVDPADGGGGHDPSQGDH